MKTGSDRSHHAYGHAHRRLHASGRLRRVSDRISDPGRRSRAIPQLPQAWWTSEVLREGFKLAKRLLSAQAAFANRIANAVLHVVLDQRALGVVDHALHRLKLLRQFETRPAFGKHGQKRTELALGLLQSLDKIRVRSVLHDQYLPPRGEGVKSRARADAIPRARPEILIRGG